MNDILPQQTDQSGPSPAPDANQPTTQQQPAPKHNFSGLLKILAIAGILLMVLAGVSMIASRRQPDSDEPVVLDPPIFEPTPIVRPQTAIASTSAFIAFSESVASLSSDIHGFDIRDAALTPPILRADLGL